MKRHKIYVSSPHDKLGGSFNKEVVREAALEAILQAQMSFGIDHEYFSPVLAFMDSWEAKSRKEVMEACMLELSLCDALFIPDVIGAALSDGINEEYVLARSSNKLISFASKRIQDVFIRRSLK